MSALTQQQHHSRQQHSHSGNDRPDVQRAVARSDRQPDAEERKAHREQYWCSGLRRPARIAGRSRRLGGERSCPITRRPPVSRVCQAKQEHASGSASKRRRDDAVISHG